MTEESKEDSAKPVEPTTLDLSAPSNDPDDGDDLFATPSSDLPVKKETVPSSSLTLNGEKPSADMLTPEEVKLAILCYKTKLDIPALHHGIHISVSQNFMFLYIKVQ